MEANPYWNMNLEWAIPLALVGALAVAVPTWLLTRRRSRRVRWLAWGGVIPFVLFVHPLSSWIVWEPVNKWLLSSMNVEAQRIGLEGRTFAEIEALLGEPGFVRGPDEKDRVTWSYHRPWFYLFGSKFEVHFSNGIVRGWEPYDD